MTNEMREQRLHAILHDYLQAIDRGDKPDRQRILDAHPDLRDELAEYFADASKLERVAKSLKTVTFDSGPSAISPTLGVVRYFGDYELLEEIARGGMGVVYKARQVSLNRIVAVKMILKGELATPEDVRRFRQEAEAAANLDHPNIVPIYEVGEHEGQQYFSMKLVEGPRIADVMSQIPDWKAKQRWAARLVATVARGVHHAHQRGIMHRDLKPGNILLQAGNSSQSEIHDPLVTDFGLAKRVEGGHGLTQSGAIVGTPAYMAPEQARAEKGLSTAVDVYSLGAILYDLLTGQPPFRGATPLETVLQLLEKEPAKLRTLNSQIDRDLETICLNCLEKDPKRRYGSAEALAEELERWLKGEPIQARSAGMIERTWKWARRRPAAAMLLAVSFVAAFLLLWVTAWAVREAERKDAMLTRAEWLLYAGQISAAQREWEVGDAALAWHHWGLCREDFRGWEHRYLFTLFNSNQATFRGHTTAVNSVAYSPNGNRIASGGWGAESGEVKVWDAEKGTEFFSLKGHTGGVTSVAFSPDGKRLASASGDVNSRHRSNKPEEVKVWDIDKGTEVLSLKGHTSAVHSVAFSPDGKRIASATGDAVTPGELKLWDAVQGTCITTLKRGGFEINCVAYSPNGKYLASVSQGVVLWDAETGAEIRPLHAQHDGIGDGTIKTAAFSPDGKRLACAGSGRVYVFDVQERRQILSLKGHRGGTYSVAFSPDGNRIASGGKDRSVKVWDLDKGMEVLSLMGHTGAVTSVAFRPGSNHIVTGSEDGTVKVWNTQKDQRPQALKGQNPLALSRDGKRIACSWQGWDNSLRILDADTGAILLSLHHKHDGHHLNVQGIAFSPDGKRLASASGDDTVRLWDAATGLEVLSFTGGSSSVAFSPNGKHIAIGGNGVKIRDADTGQEVCSVSAKDTTGYVTCIAYSPDGKRIASNCSFGVKVWDAEKGTEVLGCGRHAKIIFSVAYSPDGKRIASASEDQTVKIWDAHNGSELVSLQGHTDAVHCAAFSPDGMRIATASWDRTIKVWSASSGQETLTLKHADRVGSVAFSPDGKRIISGNLDNTVTIWDASLSAPSQAKQ